MAEGFANFYINHVPRRQNAHADALASLAASLALPAGAVEKVFIYSHDLYCPRIALEDYQESKRDCQGREVLESQPVWSLETGDFLTLTMSCTASCLRTPKKWLPFEGKPPNSTIMRLREHCIIDRMMGSCSAAFHQRRPKMY